MKKSERFGVIDIGSNTIRFNMYKEEKNKYRVITSKKTFAGLSSYVDDNHLSKAGVNKLIKILKKFKRIIEELELEETYVFATAAVRNVDNSAEVLGKARKETGLDIKLLSGEDEGYCDYLGAQMERKIKDGYLIDIGGGSTEIILVEKGVYKDTFSMSEGSLSTFKKFVKGLIPTLEEEDQIRSYIGNQLGNLSLPKRGPINLYGIGGTIRAAGNMAQEVFETDNSMHLSLKEAQDLIRKFMIMDAQVLHKVIRVSPDRLHTQVPGMIILDEVMNALNLYEIEIGKNGVREGYAYLNREELRNES